tara:strand:+ start:1691 stop:2443 length:753 start_codon:yes stop_codon:yes gene_type:complete
MRRPWLRIRKELVEHEKVAAVAASTGAHPAHVVGGLVVIWSVADDNDGRLPFWGPENADQAAGVPGIGSALLEAGWLSDGPHGLLVPEFENWMGGTVHKRDQAAERKRRSRAKCDAGRDSERDTERDPSLLLPSPSPSPSGPSPEEKKSVREKLERLKAADRELVGWVTQGGLLRAVTSTFSDPVGQAKLVGDRKRKDAEAVIVLAAKRGVTLAEIQKLIRRMDLEKNSIKKPWAWLHKVVTEDHIGIGV